MSMAQRTLERAKEQEQKSISANDRRLAILIQMLALSVSTLWEWNLINEVEDDDPDNS